MVFEEELREVIVKKGFFGNLSIIAILAAILSLSGCATFLDMGEEDGLAYDRGYASTTPAVEEDDDAPCSGRFCEARANTRAETITQLGEDDITPERAIQARDVVLGMTREQVQNSWGYPQEREVAGREGSGHERWTYGSKFSLNGSRVVIFENGRVAGWKR